MNKFAIKRTGTLQVAMFREPKDPTKGNGYTSLELVSTDAGKVEVLDLYAKGNFAGMANKKVEANIEISARAVGDGRAELRGEVTDLKAI